MKRFVLSLLAFSAILTAIPALSAQQKPTFTTIRKWVTIKGHPNGGIVARFIPRSKMAGIQPYRRFQRVATPIPATILPVDCTGGQTVSVPMDGNDSLGDCGMAMMNHADDILTYGQGKAGWTQATATLSALEKQYEQLSGGDNGMDEDMCVGKSGAWIVGLAGRTGSWGTPAVVYESLDIDLTNVPLVQYAIDQFYTVQMAWSVPDSFINNFTHGQLYDAPVTPNPNNGHYTPLTDIDIKGNYTLDTWGDWCRVTPAFVAQVQPSGFVAFGVRQFNPATGYDSHGRHITTQNAAWVAMGGTSLPSAVIAAFPPVGAPPAPVPTPTPAPTPTPLPGPVPVPAPGVTTTITLNNALAAGSYEIAPTGTASAIVAVDQAVQALKTITGTNNPPAPAPVATLEQRVGVLETAVATLTTGMNRLIDVVGGIQASQGAIQQALGVKK